MERSSLVIIPTYNEAHNIARMIDELMGLEASVDVLIIDDSSPDETSSLVKKAQEKYDERLRLIERPGKKGLGTAYVEGFGYALAKGYEYICEMDADFSHSPADVPILISEVKSGNADVAIGSRYVNGIRIVNWPLNRLILSYSANLYARVITGLSILDTTAGFKCIHRRVLEEIQIDRIRSNGYAFQIELHFRAWKAGFKLKEVPVIFTERKEGESKLSKGIVWEAMRRVWSLKFRSLMRRL